MALASQAFADRRRHEIFSERPQPTPQVVTAPPPWLAARNGEMPPLMLQLRFRTGETISYAYSDIREVRVRDAGHVQLGIFGMWKLCVTIEGRHLRELANLIGCGVVRWVQEADERDISTPETSPSIASITIERVVNE